MLGIDDFALRRGLVYATVLIDAETGRRVDVVPGRTTDVAEAWLRDHPGAEVLCRDGSGAYAEAARRALPSAVQVSDRWHLWHLLGEAARKEVLAHSACWARGMPMQEGKRAETTRERWQQVRDLREKGAGLLECARRLGLSLNTVKRYDRASEPERLQCVPKYRPTLVGPLPRPPARAPRKRARSPRSAAPAGDPRARLPGQLQPPRPLHQPGATRRQPAAPVTPPGHPAPAHQAGPPHQQPGGDPRPDRGRLPRDARPASLIRDFAALLAPDPGQRHAAAGVDHVSPHR